MVLDECSPVIIFLQSEHEARRFRDKVKFDCFKPAFIKTSIAEIDILDSEEDGNADPRSVAGYVKRRESAANGERLTHPRNRMRNARSNSIEGRRRKQTAVNHVKTRRREMMRVDLVMEGEMNSSKLKKKESRHMKTTLRINFSGLRWKVSRTPRRKNGIKDLLSSEIFLGTRNLWTRMLDGRRRKRCWM
jgi:hypothetical protein